MSDDERHSGGCLCGAIRYELAGAPTSSAICYCTQCQRQTGALVPMFVSYARERVTLTAGEPASFRSSERAVRQFCSTCGSSLFWREDGSGELEILAGTLDDLRRMPTPTHAIWALHRAPWLPEFEGVASYAARRVD